MTECVSRSDYETVAVNGPSFLSTLPDDPGSEFAVRSEGVSKRDDHESESPGGLKFPRPFVSGRDRSIVSFTETTGE